MKQFIFLIFILSILSCYEKDEINNIIVQKQFVNDNTYEIVCNGWPKEELTGKARIESAKEAALINAQFAAKNIFKEPVDAVKHGTILKYDINDDYITIHYVITYKDLKKYFKE